MEIKLTEQTKQMIAGWLAAGAFRSPAEVIEAGVEKLGSAEAPTMESLRAKIQEGLDDLEAGGGREIDIDEFIRECEQNSAPGQ